MVLRVDLLLSNYNRKEKNRNETRLKCVHGIYIEDYVEVLYKLRNCKRKKTQLENIERIPKLEK